MPELPEVEAWRKLAETHAVGKKISAIHAADDPLIYRISSPAEVASAMRHRKIVAAHRRGKYLWLELDRRPWPLLHFGMGGSLLTHSAREPHPRWWKLVLHFDDGSALTMRNIRRIGRVFLVDDPRTEPPVCRLGPDPLHELATPSQLAERLRGRAGLIKPLLLRQDLFAGVGNWIADEVLYQAGISPHRTADSLSKNELRRLHGRLGSVIRRAVEVDADSERFPRSWLFHHRWGKTKGAVTGRGEAIRFDTIAGRTAAWVPTRQR